jgi:hypothetical protein
LKNVYAYDGAKIKRKKFFGLSHEKGLNCLVIFSLKVNKKSIMVHPIKLCKVSSHICHHIILPIEITLGIAYSCFMVQKILITTLIVEHFFLLPKILTKLGLFVYLEVA